MRPYLASEFHLLSCLSIFPPLLKTIWSWSSWIRLLSRLQTRPPSSSSTPPIPQSICFGGGHPLIKSLSFHFYFPSFCIIYLPISSVMVSRYGGRIGTQQIRPSTRMKTEEELDENLKLLPTNSLTDMKTRLKLLNSWAHHFERSLYHYIITLPFTFTNCFTTWLSLSLYICITSHYTY